MADDKKFVVLSTVSVKTLAESVGVGRLSEEIAGMLAEDVCYRLREVTQVIKQWISVQLCNLLGWEWGGNGVWMGFLLSGE